MKQVNRKSRSKYVKGKQIRSLDVLAIQSVVFVNGKVFSQGWVSSWPVRLALNYLDHGLVYQAVRKDDAK